MSTLPEQAHQRANGSSSLQNATVICPFTLRFTRQSLRFHTLFGYRQGEMLGLRMLCGPQTDLRALIGLIRKAFEYQKPLSPLATHLYTRSGEPVAINLVAQYFATTSCGDKPGVRLLSILW